MRGYWLPLVGLTLASQLSAQCKTPAIGRPFDVVECGATPNASVDQTAALQSAINASCALATSSSAPSPVHIPAGQYIFISLMIRCSGLLLNGDGSGGKGGGRGGTQLCSSHSSAPMLTIGTPSEPVGRVTLQDFELTGYCGPTFPPGGITMACLYCHINRIAITGFNKFGIEFTGAASECCGFDDVNQAEIDVSPKTTLPTFAFQVTGMPGAAGGPDGISVVNTNVDAGCSATGNGFISFVNPGRTLTASSGWIGNRFEAGCDYPFSAITGITELVRFTSNRWENTGSGGLAINVSNPLSTEPPAIFIGNIWACGPGDCSYKDATGRSVRSNEYYGPSTTSPNFFTSQTGGGGATAITRVDQTAAIPTTEVINTGRIPGDGVYRLTVSLILTKAGSGGAVTAQVGWNNGILEQKGVTAPLSVTSAPGTEVDGSFLFFAAGKRSISYRTTLDGVSGAPQYSIRVRLEYVSP